MHDTSAVIPRGGELLAWFGLGLLVVVLALASSTDDVDVWRTTDEPVTQATPVIAVDELDVVVAEDQPSAGPNAASIVVLVALIMVALVVLKPTIGRSWIGNLFDRRFGWGRLESTTQEPLPAPPLSAVAEQLDAARLALLDGDARNGIVACWMRLERGALDEGLPRLAAETAVEFTERLAASGPIDSEALDELAALFREARFSGHTLDEQHRMRAAAALGRVSVIVDREGPVGS